MPWGEGPGALPPMRRARGAALVGMAAETAVHEVAGADELGHDAARQYAWQDFADLMSEVAHRAPSLDEPGRSALAAQVDSALAGLRRLGVTVLAGRGGAILFVAVVPAGRRRDLRLLFAAG